jgi:hypothetical protein
VSTAERECDVRLFWNCKLYENQRASMMDILSEYGKTVKVSYSALKARERKEYICARLHKQNS